MNPLRKISLSVGLVTAAAIILYEAADQLYLYHYLRYEYYITGIAIAALLAGIIISRRYFKEQVNPSICVSPVDGLTAKELDILQLIWQGKSNKEIAAGNFIEISTVKTHINNIYNKLGVKSRKEAIKACANYFAGSKSTLSPPFGI